jgi:hypothetical protein
VSHAATSASLTPRQRRASRYLALGLSQRAAARRLGMNERTVRRWLTDVPGFRELVEEQRAAGVEEDANDVLLDLLHDPDSRVRLAAARELRRAPNPNPKLGDEYEDEDLGTGW